MNRKKTKNKKIKNNKKEDNFIASKKDLAKFKAAYKKGNLRFDSKEVSDSILNDFYFKKGLTNNN